MAVHVSGYLTVGAHVPPTWCLSLSAWADAVVPVWSAAWEACCAGVLGAELIDAVKRGVVCWRRCKRGERHCA